MIRKILVAIVAAGVAFGAVYAADTTAVVKKADKAVVKTDKKAAKKADVKKADKKAAKTEKAVADTAAA